MSKLFSSALIITYLFKTRSFSAKRVPKLSERENYDFNHIIGNHLGMFLKYWNILNFFLRTESKEYWKLDFFVKIYEKNIYFPSLRLNAKNLNLIQKYWRMVEMFSDFFVDLYNFKLQVMKFEYCMQFSE